MKIHPATQYALEAVERKRIVGNSERLSCLRHLRDLARSGQLPKTLAERVEACTGLPMPTHDKLFPWMFDEVQASFVAIEWFKNLRHIEGKLQGKPIVLIPAHVFDISCMFGWTSRVKKITRSDGRKVGERRFRKALITEGRKNAKTTRLSGISLYLMIGDNEYNPKVYCAAVDKGQARELYDKAKLMAETSPDILSRLKVRDYTPGTELVAVHDGARPLIAPAQIERCLAAARVHGAAACARPLTETLKRADANGVITGSIEREGAWIMETPQVFRLDLLTRAYEAVLAEGRLVTDEVSAVQHLGAPVHVVVNDGPNPKITFAADLALAEKMR